MKKLEIKTEKATLLVVDLPKEAKYFENSFDWENYYLCWHDGQKDENGFISGNHGQITLGKGKYKYLGKVSEITEYVWKGIIDASEKYLSNTATESGLSLLKANGVLLENKYQDDWDELCVWGYGDFSKDGKSSFELYTEEQQKVWSNPHVFIKIV